MDTFKFVATVLFGSMRPHRPSTNGGGGGGAAAAAVAAGGQAGASLVRVIGAFPDCVLSKLNSDGAAFASMTKRLIADYCGVSYKAAFESWVAEIEAEVEWELGWACDVVPKGGGAKQNGLRYDNLEFKDVRQFVGGKTRHELRVGDEVAFPTGVVCTISRVVPAPLS